MHAALIPVGPVDRVSLPASLLRATQGTVRSLVPYQSGQVRLVQLGRQRGITCGCPYYRTIVPPYSRVTYSYFKNLRALFGRLAVPARLHIVYTHRPILSSPWAGRTGGWLKYGQESVFFTIWQKTQTGYGTILAYGNQNSYYRTDSHASWGHSRVVDKGGRYSARQEAKSSC